MHRALAISELLRHIFLSVLSPKPRDMLRFALVSRNWASIALPLLWGHPNEDWMSRCEIDILAGLVDVELRVFDYLLADDGHGEPDFGVVGGPAGFVSVERPRQDETAR